MKTLEFTLTCRLANRVLFMENKLVQKNIQIQEDEGCRSLKMQTQKLEQPPTAKDTTERSASAFISAFDEDGKTQRFPRVVGRVCCHILRLSGKVCSFLFFSPCC